MRSFGSYFLALASASLCLFSAVSADTKGVFAHYMVCGLSSIDQAQSDVRDAQKLGVDAFALNIQNVVDSWATEAVQWLFDAAAQNGFKLFFSLDMSVLNSQDPASFTHIFEQYTGNDTYYKHDGKPFVTTYNGGILTNADWVNNLRSNLEADGVTPYFVGDFGLYSSSNAASTSGALDSLHSLTAVDGVFSWETAWPSQDDGIASILSSTTDKIALAAAHATSKTYLMPLSSHQFKHVGGLGNWYRRGELNLPNRMKQILELQPDFVMLLTWNDAGESHYIGNVWQESISTSQDTQKYVDGYDHTAWQDVIAPFISAYKNGASDSKDIVPLEASGNFTGAMWYRTLLTTASCSGDPLGKPEGASNAQDTVNFAIVLPADTNGAKINVYSGDQLLKTFDATAGLNAQAVSGMKTGAQKVELVDASGNVMGAGLSKDDVQSDSDFCNFNYQVVHVA